MSYIIIYNKYIVKLNTFTNFKINSFVFINTFYTINIIKFLNVKV
jgi:hypothetical protein